MSTINLKVEFSGGLELLFGNQRTHTLSLHPPSASADESATPPTEGTTPTDVTLTYLMHHLRTHVLTERPELFMEGDTVRPGILVLINDTDWELEGEGAYVLKGGDEIVFISTLHGG
ncbi:ubiquitin-like modifier 1 [Butyriboletus roseoflavus]|nr:ubiquitin-like modifier 1 [Butyriboletus roseoflavus]